LDWMFELAIYDKTCLSLSRVSLPANSAIKAFNLVKDLCRFFSAKVPAYCLASFPC
jgi:hypothetical protein